MGGRGTFAAGNPVAYTYEVDSVNFADGRIEGVKVLKGMAGSGLHGLPESSHSSNAYIKMNSDGTFNMMRFYDSKHALRLEIAYHPEPSLGKGKILHYHIYDENFSKTKSGDFIRSKAKIIKKNSRIYRRYKTYFKGVTL